MNIAVTYKVIPKRTR